MFKSFKLKEKNAKVVTEIIAGLTTFLTMAYVLFMVPKMVTDADPSGLAQEQGVYVATCLAAFAGTLLMGLLANLPLAVAPGIGATAFFAYTIMAQNGYTYAEALVIVFLSSLLFMLITVCGLTTAINKALPKNLKIAISAGIGLFIAFYGLKHSGIIVAADEANKESFTTLFNMGGLFDGPISLSTYNALMALAGILIMGLFARLKIPGGILFGFIASAALYWVVTLTTGLGKLPETSVTLTGIGEQFGAWLNGSFGTALTKGFGTVFKGETFWKGLLDTGAMVLSMTMVSIFTSTGVMLGTAAKGDMLDDKGELPEMKKALLADSISNGIGSIFGAPTAGTSVESSAGVTENGKTGLASVITALCFLAALFLAPFSAYIPDPVIGAVLVFVGMLMMKAIKDFDWSDPTDALPAFVCILAMPLTGSIAEGIFLGVIMHVLLKLVTLRFNDMSIAETILAAVFILRYLFLM